jgi:hypothetical protein
MEGEDQESSKGSTTGVGVVCAVLGAIIGAFGVHVAQKNRREGALHSQYVNNIHNRPGTSWLQRNAAELPYTCQCIRFYTILLNVLVQIVNKMAFNRKNYSRIDFPTFHALLNGYVRCFCQFAFYSSLFNKHV